MTAGDWLPVTFAICSNRPDLLVAAVARMTALLGHGDYLLVIADTPAEQQEELTGRTATSDLRIRLLCNGRNQGLAYSRNKAMKESPTRHLIFFDDDVVPTATAIARMRDSLAAGTQIVGVRITADLQGRRKPWFLTPGQLHYLGSHDPRRPASIWGGCFGVDIERVRLLGVSFDEQLGRVGTALTSAEDTTFVRAMAARGARSEVLHDVEVHHLIPPTRLALAYLLRRAYWQGRSEVRRRDARRGVGKEGRRNWSGRHPVLASLYLASVLVGAGHEALVRLAAGAARVVDASEADA